MLTCIRGMYYIVETSKTEIKPVPYVATSSSYWQQITYNKTTDEITIKNNSGVPLNHSIYIIMEYTKTTD